MGQFTKFARRPFDVYTGCPYRVFGRQKRNGDFFGGKRGLKSIDVHVRIKSARDQDSYQDDSRSSSLP